MVIIPKPQTRPIYYKGSTSEKQHIILLFERNKQPEKVHGEHVQGPRQTAFCGTIRCQHTGNAEGLVSSPTHIFLVAAFRIVQCASSSMYTAAHFLSAFGCCTHLLLYCSAHCCGACRLSGQSHTKPEALLGIYSQQASPFAGAHHGARCGTEGTCINKSLTNLD